MAPVQLLAAASGLAFIAVGVIVSVKLLSLARRTRAVPETLIGGSLLLLAGVAWPLLLVASAPEPPPLPVVRVAWVCASVAMSLGFSGVYLFTWRVFRPAASWARLVAGIGILVELGAGAGSVLRGLALADPHELRSTELSGFVLLAGAQAVYVWSAIESFRYRALLQRRVPLGLADPLLADRFGLWGFTGAFGFVSIAPAVLAHVTGGDPNSQLSHVVVGCAGLVSSAALYLAFSPPAPYARFVRERAKGWTVA